MLSLSRSFRDRVIAVAFNRAEAKLGVVIFPRPDYG